ncbi:hypothetical protein K432DRAFT_361667 [Lepidopterella palustris CBS 459.81]|uniref:60S ribosomal protein L20 n=1 Tax=Lepidopterella palustris CBS 459.81 TaxID=1314670 RepID=A0A8E2JBA0_9PEZI|nr:hypothetical protein K432DRAFT_361667 [Lepidopterella palustris CBS 459.81]
MSTTPLTRPSPLLKTLHLLSRQTTRCESTTRRLKKLHALPPSPSYDLTTPPRSTKASPASTASAHIIFNPPSSAPTIYHTPPKFLPATDPRRKLYSSALASSTTTALSTRTPVISSTGTPLSAPSFLPKKPSAALPPPLQAPKEKKYHLTDAEISEIRALRFGDPDTWTRAKLAERFDCSQFFVSLVCKVPEKGKRVEKEHQEARERWGGRRRMAREDRVRRREGWGRD